MKRYFQLAIRNLSRNKGFSLINVLGLALGTSCCLYILLFIRAEFSYDEHHAGTERIFRITTELGALEDPKRMATCSPPIPGAMKRDFPEVEEATRFVGMFTGNQQIFRLGEKVFYETDGVYADSTFFKIFSYRFVSGDPGQALAVPNSIVLLEKTAQKFFGNENPLGKTLDLDTGEGRRQLTITAIVSDELGKSHIHANYFLSMDSGGAGSYALTVEDWAGNNFTNAYVKLRPNVSAAGLERKLPEFLERYGGAQLHHYNLQKRLILQPVTEIHTTTTYEAEPSKPVSTSLLSILLIIAVAIQLIACINFMNLSTARASQRVREIGIRKVVGAQRGSLIMQFLNESLVVAFLAMLTAVPLVVTLLPFLNRMTGVPLSLDLGEDYQLGVGILVVGVATGLLAGSYPAFYLSGFSSVKGLKIRVVNHRNQLKVRQILVVFQFTLAISLIISVLIIGSQLRYIQEQDLGYEPDQKVVIPFRTSEGLKQADNYRDAIRQLPAVRSVARANNYPSQFVFNDFLLYKQGESMQEAVNVKFMQVDAYFIKTLGIELLQGRDFKQTDTTGSVLANEAMLEALSIPEESAVGQHVYFDSENRDWDFEIVGVMKDFNFNSLYSSVTPFLLLYNDGAGNSQMILDVETENYGGLFEQLKAIWEAHLPAVPFEYSFIDEEVRRQYEGDRRLAYIIRSFTFLAILISCLGLFGLAMFTVEQRTKEIGIRKVLGASVTSIVAMLSSDLVWLVFLASLIAFPLAWYFMDRWLQDFAYHVAMHWWWFPLAGVGALAIALLTVSFQSVKAAMANPVESLRNE